MFCFFSDIFQAIALTDFKADRTIGFYTGIVSDQSNEEGGFSIAVRRGPSTVYVDAADATVVTPVAYINHSCQPNAEFQAFVYAGTPLVAVVSIKPIAAGEFIHVNYGNTYDEVTEGCLCFTSSCITPREKALKKLPAHMATLCFPMP